MSPGRNNSAVFSPGGLGAVLSCRRTSAPTAAGASQRIHQDRTGTTSFVEGCRFKREDSLFGHDWRRPPVLRPSGQPCLMGPLRQRSPFRLTTAKALIRDGPGPAAGAVGQFVRGSDWWRSSGTPVADLLQSPGLQHSRIGEIAGSHSSSGVVIMLPSGSHPAGPTAVILQGFARAGTRQTSCAAGFVT